MNGDIISALVFLSVILVILGKYFYDRYLAPEYEALVKILKLQFYSAPLVSTERGVRRLVSNSYRGTFEVVKTGDILDLEVIASVYMKIDEGQKGMLTFNKNYALAFRKMGKLPKRKPSMGERALKTFSK